MEALVESIDHIIRQYIHSNQVFAKDLRQLEERLALNERIDGKRQPIIVFSHELDINWFKESIDDQKMENMLENEELIQKSFERYLKRFQRKDQKIWFFLKYKNLGQNRNVKTCDQMRENTKYLFSVDCLQIVSLSHTLKHSIGGKYVSKTEGLQMNEKLCLKRLRESHKFSDNYKEVKQKRVFTKKRFFLANIGSEDAKKCLTPFVITVFLETLDSTQAHSLYNGSHLESVVLLQIQTSEYVLLSFEKKCRPVPQLIDNFSQFLLQFPQDFQQLYDDRKDSNYSFALSLAFVFGDNISMSGSFFRLKLGLILSLLSLNEYPKKNHSSVLVICDDKLIIRRLFEWSSLLSEYRYFHKSLSVPISGQSRENRHRSLEWIDAGALQLGADGITIIGSVDNLNQLPDKERTALFHTLETNEVIARKSQPSEPSLTELELKSTIWAVIEDNIDERQYRQNTNRSQTIVWTKVFGMVYRIQNSNHNYIYTTSSAEGTEGTVSLQDWRKVIELMASISPRMTETAERLLHDYYVANRRIRGSKLNHISFETLISLSKSMAKLSLRLNVTKYDALMAVLLYEESLITRLAETQTCLGVDPIFHVLVEKMDLYIGLEWDQRMAHFECDLMRFLSQEIQTSKPIKQSLTQNEE